VLVGALVALALLAVVVLAVRASGESPADAGTDSGTTGEPTPATVAMVELAAAEFVGRPVRDVQAELVARGLQVSVAPVETAAAPAGQVLSVEPVGSVAPDTVVTVSYAVPPVVVPAPPEQPESGGDNAGDAGNGSDSGAGSDNRDGNGNGNGNGRGNDKNKDEDDD
jgi:serine/threonine-protein kinase